MAANIYVCAMLWLAVSAAPPSAPRYYSQPAQAQAQLRQINPYDYYLDNPEAANFYNQAQQKQAAASNQGGAPSRLENLEPDSEVELIPGAQQPQQPPQQNPVSPNIPGLVPGQRVFIVHMPVPGYRPGSVSGYQPVYIVAAAPQGNTGYPANAINGYQNTVLLDPSGQAVISPLLGYQPYPGIQQINPGLQQINPGLQQVNPGLQQVNPGLQQVNPGLQQVNPGFQQVNPGLQQVGSGYQQINPGYFLTPQFQSLKRPQQVVYQDPSAGFQTQQQGQQRNLVNGARPVNLAQLIALQTHAANAANSPRAAANESQVNAESKRRAQSRESTESKELEDQSRNTALPDRSQEQKA